MGVNEDAQIVIEGLVVVAVLIGQDPRQAIRH